MANALYAMPTTAMYTCAVRRRVNGYWTGCAAAMRGYTLKVKDSKTAVAPVRGRKFLGYCFWLTQKGEVKRAVATKALDAYKTRIPQFTRRTGAKSMLGCRATADVYAGVEGVLPLGADTAGVSRTG